MGAKQIIWRISALVGFTFAYWAIALYVVFWNFFLAALGDCIPGPLELRQHCEEQTDHILVLGRTIVVATVIAYLAIIFGVIYKMRRKPAPMIDQ